MTKVLVISATGNIGSYVVEQLIKKDIEVKAAVRNKEKGQKFFSNNNIEVVEFNFLRQNT